MGSAAFFAAIAIVTVLLSSWLGRRRAPVLLAAAVVAELLVLVPSPSTRRGPTRISSPVDAHVRTALRADPHGRVFGLDGKLYPNTAGALGLQDIRALDAIYPNRYMRYVQTFLAPAVFDRFTGAGAPVLLRGQPDVRRALRPCGGIADP